VTVTAYERAGQPLKAMQLMESMQKDGYDFYEIKVLNSAFKNALKLVNKVGRGLQKSGDGRTSRKARERANSMEFSDADADEDADNLFSNNQL
jgi:pentatricopeptide repeat protein